MSSVLIFGATGVTGLCAVESAILKGLKVKAFVRDESKVPESLKNKIEVIVGNVLNKSSVNSAMRNVNKVIVALGTRNDLKPTTDLSDGLKNIIDAMKTSNVEIVSVCISAFLFWEEDKVPAKFKDLNADHQRMYNALKESDLKYIAVFPPHISDSPSSDFTVTIDKSPGRNISKHDLGKFLVDSINQPEYYGKIVGLANVK